MIKSIKSNSRLDSLLNYILPSSNRSTRIFNQQFNFIFPDSKRSQISVFVIIAIMIVVAIIIIIISQAKILEYGVSGDVKPVNDFINNCIKSTVEDALLNVADSGGYYELSKFSTENNIAYYYYNGQNLMPSKEELKSEIEKYINKGIPICTKNFVDYPDVRVISGNVSSNVEISDERVLIKITYPLSIKKSDKTYVLNKFELSIATKIGLLYGISEEITKMTIKHKKDICLTCLDEISEKNDVYIKMFDYNGDVIFFIIDPDANLKGGELIYAFANKYE